MDSELAYAEHAPAAGALSIHKVQGHGMHQRHAVVLHNGHRRRVRLSMVVLS
jgi:hypothetical protein